MADENLVDLFWRRDKAAIAHTQQKYGKYLFKVAYNILGNFEDSEESVNDTYLKAWNSIPPQKPENLQAYLSKITREGSIDIYRKRMRKKRQGEYEISVDELSECLSCGDTAEETADMNELAAAMNHFLQAQTPENRSIFICRYFYFDSIKALSGYFGAGESKIKSRLHRMRKDLKAYLEKEGFTL